ncbi:MAG: hypothetical protein R3B13_03650 [Polyangiaceae bacterium]
MRTQLLALLGVFGVACTCGSSKNDDQGCGAPYATSDGGGYSSYTGGTPGWAGWGATAGDASIELTCPPDAGVLYEPSGGECVAIGCQPGRADCNESPNDGCEADLANDALACGRCEFACEGSCTLGSCFAPEVVAATPADVTTLAVVDAGVYFAATDGGVQFVAPATSSVTLIPKVVATAIVPLDTDVYVSAWSGQVYVLRSKPVGSFVEPYATNVLVDALTAADGWIYYGGMAPAGSSGVGDASVDAEDASLDATSVDSAVFLDASQLDGSELDADSSDSDAAGPIAHVYRASPDGANHELILTHPGRIRTLGLADGTLFAALVDPGALLSVDTQTLAVAEVASGNFDAYRISVDIDFVYLADRAANELLRVPRLGGTPEVLAALGERPFDIAVADGKLWFTQGDPGQLLEYGSSEHTVLAGLLPPEVPIAHHDQFLYWAVSGLGIVRLKR